MNLFGTLLLGASANRTLDVVWLINKMCREPMREKESESNNNKRNVYRMVGSHGEFLKAYGRQS